MARNYTPGLPIDTAGSAMVNSPAPIKAKVNYATDNASASSVITLSDNTTAIEVAAINGTAVIRWIPTTETAAVSPFASVIASTAAANYDHVINKDQLRRFVVPREVSGTSSLVGINIQEGLYRRVAVRTVGAASILATEY